MSTADRSLGWIVRLVLYPAVLGLVAIALWRRHAAAEPGFEPVRAATIVRGQTTAGEELSLALMDGRLRSLRTVVPIPCGDGRTFKLDWRSPWTASGA